MMDRPTDRHPRANREAHEGREVVRTQGILEGGKKSS